MDRAYSKRELDLRFKSLEEKNDAWNASIMEKLDDLDKFRLSPTLEQAKTTNGRVSNLEKWRTWLTGCAFILVPICIWMFWKWINIDQQIESSIDNTFGEYRIKGEVEIIK